MSMNSFDRSKGARVSLGGKKSGGNSFLDGLLGWGKDSVDKWGNALQGGARQIQGFGDSVLKANPGYEQGLRQLQQMNPNTANLWESLASGFTGTPQRSLTRPSGGPGSSDQSSWDHAKRFNRNDGTHGWSPQQPNITGHPGSQGAVSGDPTNPFSAPGDIMDYFNKAFGQFGGNGEGINYDPMRDRANQRFTESDAAIEAMYAQLRNEYGQSGQKTAASYDDVNEDYAQNRDDAQGAVDDGYNAAREHQMKMLANLGREGDALKLIQDGDNLTSAQGAADARIAEKGQINQDHNRSYKQAAGEQNRSLQDAAGMEGATQRSGLQGQLADLLAGYDMSEQKDRQQAQQQAMGPAMSLAQLLYQQDASKYDGWNQQQAAGQQQIWDRGQQDFDNQMSAQKMMIDQQKADQGVRVPKAPGMTMSDRMMMEQQLRSGFDGNDREFQDYLNRLMQLK